MRQIGAKVTLESKEPAATNPQVVDSSVRALLVKKNGGEGAVRVDDGTYVRTGQNQGDGFVIVTDTLYLLRFHSVMKSDYLQGSMKLVYCSFDRCRHCERSPGSWF